MNKHDDGGHAFPQHEPINNEMHPDYGTDSRLDELRSYTNPHVRAFTEPK